MLGNKKFSGIDFHDKSISCATIKMERGLPVLYDLDTHDMKVDIMEGGRVTHSDMVSTALRSSLKEGLLSKNVHIAIPTQNILIRKITSLPDIGEHELAKLLEFHIGESIHLPFENPIYDFVKIGSIAPDIVDHRDGDEEEEELSLDELAKEIAENIEGPKSEILLFATSKLLSQDLADVCTSAGLKPLTAEIRAIALQRLLLYVHPRWLKETEMIIDASRNSIDIHIFKEDRIIFSRMMSINRNDYFSNNETPSNPEVLILEDDMPLYMEDIEVQSQIAASKEEESTWTEDFYMNEIVLGIERAQNFFRYSLNERDTEFKRIIVTGENANQIFEPLKGRLDSVIVRIDYGSILANHFINEDLLDSCSVAIGLAIRANEKSKKK